MLFKVPIYQLQNRYYLILWIVVHNFMDRLIAAKKKAKCVFCKSHERDKTKYGPIFRLDDTVVHYYCVVKSLSNFII